MTGELTRLCRLMLVVVLLCLASTLALAQTLVPAEIAEVMALAVMWPRNVAEHLFTWSGFVGMILHWAKKRRRHETMASLADHFLTNYPGRSVAVVIVFWAVTMFMLTTVPIGEAKLPGAIVGGLVLGWMLDSMINKGEPPA